MARRTDGLIKGFRAGAAVAARRIVRFGASDISVTQASTALARAIGVSVELAADIGEPVDVALSGITDVDYGGAVARGDFLTSDADGRAVPAVTAGARIVGQAMVSGVAGDIGSVHLAKSVRPGAGSSIPATAMLDEDGQPILAEDGSYLVSE